MIVPYAVVSAPWFQAKKVSVYSQGGDCRHRRKVNAAVCYFSSVFQATKHPLQPKIIHSSRVASKTCLDLGSSNREGCRFSSPIGFDRAPVDRRAKRRNVKKRKEKKPLQLLSDGLASPFRRLFGCWDEKSNMRLSYNYSTR
jgi:hypothetical protein